MIAVTAPNPGGPEALLVTDLPDPVAGPGEVAVDGAALIDEGRKLQYLCAVYSYAALEQARPPYEEEHGLSMRQLVRGLRLEHVPAFGPETHDVDSWSDLLAMRETFGD